MESAEQPPLINKAPDIKPSPTPDKKEEKLSPDKERSLILTKAARVFGYPARAVLGALRENNFKKLFDTQPKEKPPLRLEMKHFGNEDVLQRFRGELGKEGRKLGIIILGGGQAGSNGAGIMLGMLDAGALDRADAVVGVSAGVPNIIGLFGGNGEQTAKIYRDVNSDISRKDKFLRIPKDAAGKFKLVYKMIKEGGPNSGFLDTNIVAREMRGPRPVDDDSIRNSSIDLVAVLMNTNRTYALEG